MNLKLNNKRTILIGFSFFTILMLWQVYNFYCPLFLRQLFLEYFGKENNYLIGLIMAFDNILALIMLPIFGTLSDKTTTKFGKRMPYIVIGTLISLLAFPFIVLLFIKQSLVGVIIMMALILIAMNIYRAPSVALMPDVTPKPLRAKANAIINFVGYIGAIIGSLLTMIFIKKTDAGELISGDYLYLPFIITSVFMLAALIVLVLKIRENTIVKQMQPEMELGEKLSETVEEIKDDKPLGKQDKCNLWILIFSVFLWYFAFNAVETFGSTYATVVLNTKSWGIATAILAISSLITFLPSTLLTKKVGRKLSIVIGLGLMVLSLGLALFVKSFGIWLILLMIVAGCGWAIINVNSYPMFVELSSSKNVGKFTGYYYSASQIAQSITPVAIGFVFDWLGYKAYFPYAAIFMAIALIVFSFVKVPKKQVELVENSEKDETKEDTKANEIEDNSNKEELVETKEQVEEEKPAKKPRKTTKKDSENN